LADGSTCQELAEVHKVLYEYERRPLENGQVDFILKEVRYHGRCPRCGERMVSVVSDANRPD
jgi:hypothetical protein